MSNDAVDLKEALERVEDCKDLLDELFDIFTEDFIKKLQDIDAAIASKNFGEIRNLAHSIKGASGNISAKSLYENFLKLEKMGEGENFEGVEDLRKEIDENFSKFKLFAVEFKKDVQG